MAQTLFDKIWHAHAMRIRAIAAFESADRSERPWSQPDR